MARRRKLLEGGKSVGKGIAGTVGSIAGTLSEKGREAGSRARSLAGTLGSGVRERSSRALSGVRDEYDDLTDETVTDQEEARLERARREAEQEARREARQEFQEEFRENVFDEAFATELQELRSRESGTVQKTRPRSQRKRQVKRETLGTETRRQREEPQRQPIGMGLFGPPLSAQQQSPREQQDRRDPPPGNVERLFGINSVGQDTDLQRDPLFGFQF